MSNTVEEATKLLEGVREYLPLKMNEVTEPSELDEVIATIRSNEGRSVILPHPEAMSLLVGRRVVFDFFVNAPRIIEELLEIVDSTPKTAKNG